MLRSAFKVLVRGILWMMASLGAADVFRRINRRKIVILLYHGVTRERLVPACSLQLDVKDFTWQMGYLRQHYHIMPLPEVLKKIRQNEPLPDNAAVVTFDDGLENNYSVAYPVLKRMGIPATIFLTTGYVGTTKILWPQQAHALLAASKKEELDLRDMGMGLYDLGSMADNTSIMTINSQVIDDIRNCFKPLSAEEKNKLLLIIRQRLQVPESADFVSQRASILSWEQVAEMQQSGLVSFGAHTMNHLSLSRLNGEELNKEIGNSFEMIRQKLGTNDRLFAYPYGTPDDFNESSKQALRAHGAACSVTTVVGLNDPDTDILELKRIYCNITRTAFKLSVSGCISTFKKLWGEKYEASR